MKTEVLRGQGVQGMRLTLNVSDMFAANLMAKDIEKTINSLEEIRKYNAAPYDKRKEEFPNGAPRKVEMSEENLKSLLILMNKLSSATASTIFSEEDEDGGITL